MKPAPNLNNSGSLIWTAWNNTLVTTSTANTWVIWTSATQALDALGAQIHATMTATATAQIWTAWNVAMASTRTPEQVAAAQRRSEEYQANQARFQAERSQAEKRAETLLHEALDPKQRAELAAKGFFTLETLRPTGERRIYRIRRGRSRNVEQIDASGRRIKTLCAHPIAIVPDPDTMLAQKLMLESAEDEFLRIANAS